MAVIAKLAIALVLVQQIRGMREEVDEQLKGCDGDCYNGIGHKSKMLPWKYQEFIGEWKNSKPHGKGKLIEKTCQKSKSREDCERKWNYQLVLKASG